MIQWLLTPSAFEGDPRGFAANQLGHVAVGAALTWLLGPLPVLAAYIAWEVFHLTQDGKAWDGAEDYGHVAAGAAAVALAPWALAVALPFFAAGVLRRAGK